MVEGENSDQVQMYAQELAALVEKQNQHLGSETK
jgi:hypothetical protein